MSVHRNTKGLWFCQFYVNGKIKRKYFGRDDLAKKRAEAYDVKLKEEKQAERAIIESSPTIAEVCVRYHDSHPVSVSTARDHFYKLKNHILPVLGHLRAEHLDTAEIDRYVQHRLKSVKWGTIKRELVILKAALSWAASSKPPLIASNPLRDYRVQAREDRDVPMPPTEAEVIRILAAAEPHIARAILLLWHTGIRPGEEMERLRWSDVDMAGKIMRVVSSKKTGRGMAIRYVPLSDELARHMEAWMEKDKRAGVEDISRAPLVHYAGQAIYSLKRSWATAKKRAGITRRMRLYDLRHRFATQLLEEGLPAGVVSKLLGHSREDTTQRHYLHVTQKHMREAVNLMPVVCHDMSLIPREGSEDKQAKNGKLQRETQPSQG